MLDVVCWKWKPMEGYRSDFTSERVNILRNMVERHLDHPHRFVCVTDEPSGLDSRIRVVPLWADHASVPNPHGGLNPSCYRRLRAFSSEMGEILGRRFVSIDLDCVVVGDLTPLFTRKEDFVIWGDVLRGTHYNGSMWLMNAGAREYVWTEFDPIESPRLAKLAGHYGSDQAWMSYRLGPGQPTWTRADGVYSYRVDMQRLRGRLPSNAKIVFFQGNTDPWSPVAKRLCPWIEEHYR